jgi:hypothetical protein
MPADSGVKSCILRGARSGGKHILRWALRYNAFSICPQHGNHNSKAL